MSVQWLEGCVESDRFLTVLLRFFFVSSTWSNFSIFAREQQLSSSLDLLSFRPLFSLDPLSTVGQ